MNWRDALASAPIIACDIETSPWRCFGFAVSPSQSYVIPFSNMEAIREVCASSTPKIWANGKFDLFVLKYLWNVPVNGETHDIMAQWFSLYPEIAGKSEKGRTTRKSLAFLSSLFTYDEYWKGDYETEGEFYEYNGKDCCITFEIFHALAAQIKSQRAEGTYEHIRDLIWPCVDMLHRGLGVDEELRLSRIAALKTREEQLRQELTTLVQPVLSELFERDCINKLAGKKTSGVNWSLFQSKEKTCGCCRSAKKKQSACWSCAGFDKAPSKKALKEKGVTLTTCAVCTGAERKTVLEWNASSHDQNKIVLYNILRLPKRMKGGKLRSDEEALKGILGQLQGGV